MNKPIFLFTLSLFLAPAARAGILSPTDFEHASCEAQANKNYADGRKAEFISLINIHHFARFDVFRKYGDKKIFVFARYSYDDPNGDPEDGRRIADRALIMHEFEPEMRTRSPELFGRDPHQLLSKESVTYYAVPTIEDLPAPDFLEAFSFNIKYRDGLIPQIFPMLARIVQEAQPQVGAVPVPIWVKLYAGSCTARHISQEEFEARVNTGFAPAGESIPRELTYPEFKLRRDTFFGAVWPAARARWAELDPARREALYRSALVAAAAGTSVYLAVAARGLIGAGLGRALIFLTPLAGTYFALTGSANADETLAARLRYSEVDRFLSDLTYARQVLATTEQRAELSAFYALLADLPQAPAN